MRKVNFKKSYSQEVFSFKGRNIFFSFLFVVTILLVLSFLVLSCENGFCPKKISELTKVSSTGKVVESFGTDYNSIETLSKLIPGGASTEDSLFGHAMASDGKTLVVSAPYADRGYRCSGAVYIFEKSSSGSWVFKSKLSSPSGAGAEFFGLEVSLDSDNLLVGSNHGNFLVVMDSSGSWNFKTWFFETRACNMISNEGYECSWPTLNGFQSTRGEREFNVNYVIPSSYGYRGHFIPGDSLLLSGNYIFIGVPGGHNYNSFAGYVSVFKKGSDGSWSFFQRLSLDSNDSPRWSLFGSSLAYSGEELFVGAPSLSGRSGRVYVFKKTLGGEFQKNRVLESNSNSYANGFGSSLAYSGEELFIGAPNDNYGKDSSLNLEYPDWKRGWILDHSEAIRLARKYNRPLIYITAIPGCNRYERPFSEILNSEEFVEYADRNKIVLLNGNGDDSLICDYFFSAFEYTCSIADKSVFVLKVLRFTYPGILDSYRSPVLYDTNFVRSLNSGYPFEDKRSAATFSYGDMYWRSSEKDTSNYVKKIDSFFPNQFWESISPGKDYGGGAVYVFKKDSSGKWVQNKRILPDDLSKSDSFGESISVDGNFLVVGSSSKPIGKTPNRGSAYVFKKCSNGWEQMNSIHSKGSNSLFFGRAVLISNDSIFVAGERSDFAKSGGDVFSYQLYEAYSDKVPPTISGEFSHSTRVGKPISIQLNAQDESGISSWRMLESSYFSMSSSGLIKNKSHVPGGNYSLTFFVNDSFNNIASGKVEIEVISGPYCGDSICDMEEGNETCSNCVEDCGACPSEAFYFPPADEAANVSVSRFNLFDNGYYPSIPVGNSLIFPFKEDEYEMVLDGVVVDDSVNVSIYRNGKRFLSSTWEFSKGYDVDLDNDSKYDLTFYPSDYILDYMEFKVITYKNSSLQQGDFLLFSDEGDVGVNDSVNTSTDALGSDVVDTSNDAQTNDKSDNDSSSGSFGSDEGVGLRENKDSSNEEDSSKDEEDSSSKDEKSFPWVAVLFVILLVAFILVLVYLFLKRDRPRENRYSVSGSGEGFGNPPVRGNPYLGRSQIQNRNAISQRPVSFNQGVRK